MQVTGSMILYLLTICLVTSVNGLLPTSQLLIGDNIGDATILASVCELFAVGGGVLFVSVLVVGQWLA